MASIAIGHDLGLFKVLCEAKEPMSLKDIAGQLDLKERYTKEWLSCMVAAGFVHQDRQTNMYTVPERHKPTLSLSTGFAGIVFQFGKRADRLKQCFAKDGPYGISYAESPDWFDWFDGYRGDMCEHTIDSEVIPVFTKQGLIPKLESGIKVLDLGCGPGRYTNTLAQRFPNSTFTGMDISSHAIELACAVKERKGLKNVTFIEANLLNLQDDWTGAFDMVFVYDVLHDLPDPFKALSHIYRVLKDDGCLSLVDFGYHSNPVDNAGDTGAAMYYSCSQFICLPSSMNEEPHIGYGANWGMEEIEKAVKGANFKVQEQSSIVVLGQKVFFLCTK